MQLADGGPGDRYLFPLGWRPGGKEFLFLRVGRTYQRIDLLAADVSTGTSRTVLTETSGTFIEAVRLQLMWQAVATPLDDGQRFIWRSERDGWSQLYLYDFDGRLLRRLTRGAFPVERVEGVDEAGGWVYFTAHGDAQRPYDLHLYRVRLDGTGQQQLTEATGQHSVQLSPSRQFFLDTHSTLDRPPRTELRAAGGTLLRVLSEADVSALAELGWQPPEEFVVKAADGTTDLWGALFKPRDFDPRRKYPVLDSIYNGPFVTWVPRTFLDPIGIQAHAMAQLGFLVLVVDGRGTPHRGKAFQDVVYLNFGRNEIPDHVAALHALAARNPALDLDRVGIYGGSWGGYMTLRAMLTAPEVYRVGVATNSVVDFYDHEASSIEGYMGLPQEHPEAYEYGSNLRLADRLQGQLLMVHSTSDVNATFSATVKMIQAFILADRPFDFLPLPDQSHIPRGTSQRYWLKALRSYFVERLQPPAQPSVP